MSKTWLRKASRSIRAATIVVFSNSSVHLKSGRFVVTMVLLFSPWSEMTLNSNFNWCRINLRYLSLSRISKSALASVRYSAETIHPTGGKLAGLEGIRRKRIQFLLLQGKHRSNGSLIATDMVGQVILTLLPEHPVQFLHSFSFVNRSADITADIPTRPSTSPFSFPETGLQNTASKP